MYIRHSYLNQLIKFKDSDFIKVITGVRRCGKSILLQQYTNYLKESGIDDKQIIYLNFESFEFRNIKEEEQFGDLISSYQLDPNIHYYLMIDEIQFVNGWQRVINSLRVSYSIDIIITGSNANLLSGELATLLSGRYVEIVVYPFSFIEFLEAKELSNQSRSIDNYYKEYEKYGGFPGVILSDHEIKNSILSGIYDSIILNDIAHRGNIKDTLTLKHVISFLADNVGQLVTPNKISNTLKNENIEVSNHSINRYLHLLQEAYLFFEAKQYDTRGKAYLKQNSKYIMIDNGLRNQAVDQRSGNFGNRLENIVYIELLRRGYKVDVARINNKEIDFIARKGSDIQYIQVCFQLPENSHETDNLLLIDDNYSKKVITGRYPETNNIDGIEIIYIVDWLLKQHG